MLSLGIVHKCPLLSLTRICQLSIFNFPLYFFELALGGAADGALPRRGQILKGSAGRDAVIGVAHLGIINIGAFFAFVALALLG